MAKVLTDAAVRRLTPNRERRVIRDGGSRSLYLVIQPSGTKSWMLRFRKGKMVLGSFDPSGEFQGEPTIGIPLTLAAARQVAAQVLRERSRGSDVVADHKARKHRQRTALAEQGASTFATLARQFVEEHARPNTRNWRETARNLGLDPSDELEVINGSLASRWAHRDVKALDSD